MIAVAGGLRRLLGAPLLWSGTFLGVAALAGLVGLRVRMVVTAAVGPFDALDRTRLLFDAIDVLREHPTLGADLVVTAIASAGLSLVAWTLLAPLCIARLAGHRGAHTLGGRALAGLPAVLVQTLWHGLLRAGLVVAVLLAVRPLPSLLGWIVVGIAWLLGTVALDVTRVAVVEHAAAPWHPRTAWRGLVRTVRRPGLFVPCAVLALAQVAIAALIVWLALRGYGDAPVWPARALALLSTGLGLWRLATVVEDAAREAASETP